MTQSQPSGSTRERWGTPISAISFEADLPNHRWTDKVPRWASFGRTGSSHDRKGTRLESRGLGR